jgi:predicted O-methyltransferase YrrM
MLNTGCWVCRFDPSWVKRLWFTIDDRIIFDEGCGRYRAQAWSEDWFFSKKANELGLRIGCTRKIPIIHQGEALYTNQRAWGTEKFDSDALEFSALANGFPYEIPGWLKPEEGRALGELARGKRVLEIGSYCGLSTVCLARTAEHVTAMDYFDGRATPAPYDTREIFNESIRRYGLDEKVTVAHPDDSLPEEFFDLVFIDGAHDYESVRHDILKATAALKPDGLLAFHDYRRSPHEFQDSAYDPGVTQAVNELLEVGGELISRHATVAVVRPPAALPLEV